MSVKPETVPYRAAFDAHRGDALIDQRRAAFARFEALGYPTRRDEAWRFSDPKPLQRQVYLPSSAPRPATIPRLDDYVFAGDTHRLVLVNGWFSPELSHLGALPKGARLQNTAAIVAEHQEFVRSLLDQTDIVGAQAFSSLNAALFGDGYVLVVDDGVVLDRPVEIIHWGEAAQQSFHLRNFIRLGKNAKATIIESFAGAGGYWTNAVNVIALGAGAQLQQAKVQDEDRSAIHLTQARAALKEGAIFDSFVLTLGGLLSRHETSVQLGGEGAACRLNGAYLLRGEQEATNATIVDHIAVGCRTDEVFKGVVDDRAHGVFLGRIAVHQDAQKTAAHQLNKNLLLSPRATVDTKPELEILADDVKCSHGATVGDLDEAALFYLEARGIPPTQARHMLIEAFAADALDRIENLELRGHFSRHLNRWLGAPRGES